MKKIALLCLMTVMPAVFPQWALWAQSQAVPPKFDVASVRPCRANPAGGGGGRSGEQGGAGGGDGVFPGRIKLSCLSLSALIGIAFRTDPPINSGGLSDTHPIRGGPAWAYSDLYTIEAKTDDPAPGTLLMGPMLRALLSDRFQLKLHREIEQTAMYALTVTKKGLKLKPVEMGGCTPRVDRDPAKGLLANATGKKPLCDSIFVGPDGPNLRIAAGGATLSKFAEILSGFVLDRHVIDRTGIKKIFNIDVEFARDENTPSRIYNPGAAVGDAPEIPIGASIFTAIEDQLGLRLERIRGPRGYFVIDSIERPSEN